MNITPQKSDAPTLNNTSKSDKTELQMSIPEGEAYLVDLISSFFKGNKSMAISTPLDIDPIALTLNHLRAMPRSQRVLFLVGSHVSARNIVTRFNQIELNSENLKVKMKLNSYLIHMFGKTQNDSTGMPLCHRQDMVTLYKEADIPIASAECLEENCPHTSSCTYIKQFEDANKKSIHIMTHAEISNEPSTWSKGSYDRSHDSLKPNFSGRGWKPKYIIVDGNWLTTPKAHSETLTSSNFKSLRLIIADMLGGISLHDAISKHQSDVVSDFAEMKKVSQSKKITFDSTQQYINDMVNERAESETNPQSVILETINSYIDSGFDTSKLGNLAFNEQKIALTQFTTPNIAERYKGIPILILNTSNNESALTSVVSDIDFYSIKVRPDDAFNVYQLKNFNWTKGKLQNPNNLKLLIEDLKDRIKGYDSVGLVTYKDLGKGDNFYKTLASQLGITKCAYFGNLDGLTEFDDTDVIIVVGRYKLPQNTTKAINGDFNNMPKSDGQERRSISIPLRSGVTETLRSYVYIDSELEKMDHFLSKSETIKALGLGRANKKPKDYFLYSNEYLGSDVEITGFFEFEKPVCTPAIQKLLEIGFCQDTPKELLKLGLKQSYTNKNNLKFCNECIRTGKIEKLSLVITDKHRNTRTLTYYVSDYSKLEKHLAENGKTIKSVLESSSDA